MNEYGERKKKEEAAEAARAKRDEEIRKANLEKIKKAREDASRAAKGAREKKRNCIHDGWWFCREVNCYTARPHRKENLPGIPQQFLCFENYLEASLESLSHEYIFT